MKTHLPLRAFALAAALASGAAWCGDQPAEPDPAAYGESVMKNPGLRNATGEQFCWNASWAADEFLLAYEAYRNAKWLEEAEKYYDFFVSRLEKDPDGYEGWIGSTIGNTPGIRGDALVGDAILCRHLLRFALIVNAEPELKKRFGEKAQKWIDLSTRICWEKWNKRGCYYEDGGWGSYRTHSKYIDEKTGKWVERPRSVISDNLNKHYDAAIVFLRLWQLTGKDEYRERVERIFGRAKAMWRHYKDEDRVVWNFWMPHGPYDIEGKAPKSWVGVHSSRSGYQAGEVAMYVEVYDAGLVFEQVDFERIVRTNRWMATGKKDGKPGYKCADGTSDAGQLWSALARFDEKIRQECERDLRAKSNDRNAIHLAFLKNVTEKRLGWKRLDVADESKVRVLRPPLQPGRSISMALVIPSAVETAAGSRVKFVTQARAKGTVTIELLDASGKEVLGTLHEAQVQGDAEYLAPRWDGTNPKTGKKDLGEYRVRWTLAGESRVEPVWVKQGAPRAEAASQALKPGGTLAFDFENAMDPRWDVEGGALSEEQAHGGRKSLKLTEGHSAVLAFGEDDDLPVRVSMWIYDPGAKLGKKTANGPAWGVRTGEGDKFCIRTCWRKYLGGDSEYHWFNTGENQWFTPHVSRLPRKQGWTEWVFDFGDPKAPKIAAAGKPLGDLVEKFIPKGAVAIHLLGGDQEAGPLYVDDVKIEYPKKQ